MNKQKLLHTKCPNCGEYGIPLNKTGHGLNPIVTCSYCLKKYRVNNVLSILLKISGGLIIAFLLIYIEKILNISKKTTYSAIIVLIILGIYALDRFSPLEEVNEDKE